MSIQYAANNCSAVALGGPPAAASGAGRTTACWLPPTIALGRRGEVLCKQLVAIHMVPTRHTGHTAGSGSAAATGRQLHGSSSLASPSTLSLGHAIAASLCHLLLPSTLCYLLLLGYTCRLTSRSAACRSQQERRGAGGHGSQWRPSGLHVTSKEGRWAGVEGERTPVHW